MQKIAAALLKAKQAFGPALKDKTNPAFKSKYADLGACLDAVDKPCLDSGIVLYQETFEDAGGVTVETVFLHESGESLRCGKLHVPASKQDPQGYGSALTYARRYSLMTACGIAPEDDDGNAAQQRKEPERPRSKMSNSAIADHKAAFDAANTPEALKKAGDLAASIADTLGDEGAKAELQAHYLKRKKQLTTKEPA
jgi:hypothetical protein